jgi:formylglycine-generating enzyme required for sulfatase activity
MGDPTAEGAEDERPAHTVDVSGFYMSRHEVTNMKMADVLTWAYGADLISVGAGVTWYGALAYCNYLSDVEDLERCIDFANWSCDVGRTGYRLPTEAEWEKAARGGLTGHHYPWPSPGAGYAGCIDGSMANYDGRGDPFESLASPRTTPVEYYQGTQVPAESDMANGCGLYDMAGNAREWCWDRYQADAYDQAWATQADPKGPETGEDQVLRGGSWACEVGKLRCAGRGHAAPGTADGQTGFRCARR